MEPYDAFSRAFIDACHGGDLPNTQEAIASGRLTVEDLNQGLKRATSMAHPDIVAALFDAGARVSTQTITSLYTNQQQPTISTWRLDVEYTPTGGLCSRGNVFS
ncbi:hypothetical protein BDW75DRAFT_226139 [Aspergillus navahoensis]